MMAAGPVDAEGVRLVLGLPFTGLCALSPGGPWICSAVGRSRAGYLRPRYSSPHYASSQGLTRVSCKPPQLNR